MKPSEHCKAKGLKGLKQLSEITGQSIQTLINWHKVNPELFYNAIESAVTKKERSDFRGY